MTLIKFASAAVLDARIARQGSGLVKDAHRHEFDYEPRPGFLYVRSRAISSRTNDNFDHFPAAEIKKAYRTFIGKPVFVNHHNDNHRRARGVIVDAALHEDTNPDGSEDTWAEVLMEVDAVRFPKLAQAILAGEIDRTSMGTDVAFSVCSVCNNRASTPLEYCQHIPKLKGKKIRRRTASGSTEDVLVYEKCYGLGFFENSLLVEEPADPTAFFLGVDDRGLQMAASKCIASQVPSVESLEAAAEGSVLTIHIPESHFDTSGGGVPLSYRILTKRDGRWHQGTVDVEGWSSQQVLDAVAKAPEGTTLQMGDRVPGPFDGGRTLPGGTASARTASKVAFPSTRDVMDELDGNKAHGEQDETPRAKRPASPASPSSGGTTVQMHWSEEQRKSPGFGGASQEHMREIGDKYERQVERQHRNLHRQHTALGETMAPAQVDTLRDEACPVCGESDSYDGDRCLVCNFIKPPDEFLDPDLEKAKQVDLRQDQQAQTQTTQDGLADPNQAQDGALQEGAADPDRPWLSKELPAGGPDPAASAGKPWEQKERPKAENDAAESTEDGADQDKPWKHKTRRKSARVTTQKENSMRPALAALAEQQKQIEALREGIAFIAEAAGISGHPRIAALMKKAEDENPAQPEGWANPGGGSGTEAPTESTQQAATPEAKDDPTSQGSSPLTDVSPDATTSLSDTGTVLDESLDLNEKDVTAPVAGTEDLGKGSRGQEGTNRVETDVRAGTPSDTGAAFTETGWTTSSKTPSEGRTIASLRLARLRMQAGIEAGNDDLAVGTAIASSEVTDEAIQSEIDTLAKVVEAQRTASVEPGRQAVARNLVPRAASQAQRTVPSFTAEPSLPMQTVASGPSDDEFAFE